MPTESYKLTKIDALPIKPRNIFWEAILEFITSDMIRAEIEFKSSMSVRDLCHALQAVVNSVEAPVKVIKINEQIYLEKYHRV